MALESARNSQSQMKSCEAPYALFESTCTTSRKLNRNEFHFHHAPKVRATMAKPNELSAYAQPLTSQGFIQRIATYLNVNTQNLTLGHGAEDLLLKILLLKRQTFKKILIPSFSWGEYTRIAHGFDFEIESTPMCQTDRVAHSRTHGTHWENQSSPSPSLTTQAPIAIDLRSVRQSLISLRSANQQALVLLATTNNPTGARLEESQVKILVTEFPEMVFILDAVYETLPSGYFKSFEFFENVFVLGSFSKYFGLPGLRLGFCTGHLPNPFKLALGHSEWQYQVAISAIEENTYYSSMRDITMLFAHEIATTPFRYLEAYPSRAPFLLAGLKTPALKQTQQEQYWHLLHGWLRLCENQSKVWPKVFFHGDSLWMRFGLGPQNVNHQVKEFLQLFDDLASEKTGSN